MALAGLLAVAPLVTGCSLVNRILGRSDAQSAATATAGAGAGGARAAGGAGAWGGQAAALPVVTADVVRQTVSSFLVATTTLSAERSLDVVARAGGEVVEVLVEEGDAVRVGQLLAQLDPSDARLALAEAQAHYDNIQREYNRTVELAEHGGVTDQELENQRYQIELRTIALERSRQHLTDTEIRSPIAGIVGARSVEAGATISANTRVFHVLDPDSLLAVMLWRMDEGYEREADIFMEDLTMPPSEYFRRQCYVSVEPDELPAKYTIDAFGNDNIVFSTDYPHGDSKYPAAVDNFFELPFTDEDRRKILWDNCARFYSIAGVPSPA